jgi:hypothetical protein
MWKTRARNLEGGILETIAWFSLFSFPPTALEVWRFLFFPASYSDVVVELSRMVAAGLVITRDGKYTLPTCVGAFDERESRYGFSLPKLERAQRAAAYLSRFSDVRAVFVCNTLSLMHAREESDVDVFVIARHGAIWRVRFAAVTPFALFGRRPKAGDERDTMCWSFFLSDSRFDVREFALAGGDPYLAFWAATLLPLYDPDSLVGKLREESGLCALFPQLASFPALPTGVRLDWILLPSFLETLLRGFQLRRFPEAIRSRIGKGNDVVVSDSALKFHTNDRRAAYRAGFEEQLKKLGL